MTPPTHTRLSGPQRREQLLDATKAIVDADGFHAVSIEAVARAAGITRPIVYHHFAGGLDDLLVALVERETARASWMRSRSTAGVPSGDMSTSRHVTGSAATTSR